MGVDGIAEDPITGKDSLAYYRRMVNRSLCRGDYMYAAEYSWMAYAQAIKEAWSNCRIDGTSSNDTIKMAQHLNEIVFNADAGSGTQLRVGFHAARSLYWHLGENDLAEDEVERSVEEVMDAIGLLRTLFYQETNDV